MIEKIRKKIPLEEFDYQTLLSCLEGYSYPRDKISELLQKDKIIRVKKGLYVFGEEYRRKPYSREILANLIYGPSCISLDYALHYHGLIPERVEAVTSVAIGRARRFETPVGLFIYRPIPLEVFPQGMDQMETGDGRHFLMTTPEKALADKLYDARGAGISTQRELEDYLKNNLRIEPSSIKEMNAEEFEQMATGYRSRKIRLLSRLIRRLNRRGEKESRHA